MAIRTSFNELARTFDKQDQKARSMGENTAATVKNNAQGIAKQGAQKLQEVVRTIIN